MSVKWSKKLAMECLKDLKNPFDAVKQGEEQGQGKGLITNVAEKIKEVLRRNK